MDADQLADAARSNRARIRRGLHRSHVASHDGCDKAGIDLLPTDEHDVRSLDHGVGRFDHADEAPSLDEAERFTRE